MSHSSPRPCESQTVPETERAKARRRIDGERTVRSPTTRPWRLVLMTADGYSKAPANVCARISEKCASLALNP